MRFHFPATTTTYNLVTEYCTIYRLVQYQQSAASREAGFQPTFDTRAHEKIIYECCIQMGWEVEAVAKGDKFDKEDLTRLLLSISNDERIAHFKVSATLMIEDFNTMFKASPIKRGDAYDDFMKDGHILSDHLLSNANHYLKKHFSKEVDLINSNKENVRIKEVVKPPKIRMALNIDQFAYLIRLMQESNLFESSVKTELAKLIIAHFSTKGTEEIGETSMVNKLSETNKSEAVYWEKLLKRWRDKALKV